MRYYDIIPDEKIKLNLDMPCFRQTSINLNSSIRTNFVLNKLCIDKLRVLQFGKIQIYTIELQHRSDFKPNRI